MWDKISIVIPVYNEEAALAELHERLCSVLRDIGSAYEIIFVDDGSKDNSMSVLRSIQERDTNVCVLELARNYGQTSALAAGIDVASGDLIITMDGDLQHQPEEIPNFLKKLEEGYDIVSGCRSKRVDQFLSRKLPSLCANRLMAKLSGIPMHDFGSTFKAYRASILKRLDLFGDLHRFIPVLAWREGARITEIPIQVKMRGKGKSNYGLGRTFGVFEDIIYLEFYSNYLSNPIRAFGRFFFFFFGFGFALALGLMCFWAFGLIQAVVEHAALLLFSVFMMIAGIQFLVAGILAQLLSRVYLRSTGGRSYSVRNVLSSYPLTGTNGKRSTEVR